MKLLTDGACASKLREINLTNCMRLGNTSVLTLSRKLDFIFLTFTFILLFVIILRCKNLTYLALCFCDSIEEDGLDFISQMENLISIDLSGCKVGDHVSYICNQ